MTEDVWSTDVLGLADCSGNFLMKDNKVFIFISSVLEVKPTFAYMSSCLNLFFKGDLD